ncbi:MAG: zinc ribbon domain-containing protein [Halobacteriaceae archaeon]
MTGRIRTALAVVGAVIYPGVGHLVLRAWRRAIAWFGVSFFTAYTAIILSEVPVSEVESVQGAFKLQRLLPWQATAAILFVSLLNVVDVYLVARRSGEDESDDGPTCPNCGGELDDDLDFCPWCTTRLDATSR